MDTLDEEDFQNIVDNFIIPYLKNLDKLGIFNLSKT